MKLLGETDAYFDVEGPGGKFRVAKNGLGKTTVAKIRGYAGGGEVKPDDLEFKSPGLKGYADYLKENYPTLANLAQTGEDVANDTVNTFANPLGALNQVAKLNKAAPGWVDEAGGAVMDTARAAAPDLLAKSTEAKKELIPRATPAMPDKSQVPPAMLGPSGNAQGGGQGVNIPGPDMKAFASNQAQAQAGVSDQANALEEQGRLARENGADVEAIHNEKAKMEQGFVLQDAKDNAAKDASVQQFADDVSSSVKQYSDAKIDQHALWASRSTGQKALAGIGLLFGAFSPDGVNRAVGVMNDAINQDIDAQKANMEHLGKVVGEKRNLYNINVEKFKDKAVATAVTRMTMLAPLVSKLDAAMARYKGTAQEAVLAQAKGQVEQTAAQELQKMTSARDAMAQEAAYKSRQLGIEQQRNNIMAAKAAGGKSYTAGTQALADLKKQWASGGGLTGRATQYIPGSGAHKVAVDDESTALAVATQINGGKAPKPALIEHVRKNMLPQAGDSQETGDRKISNLDKIMGGGSSPDSEPDIEN